MSASTNTSSNLAAKRLSSSSNQSASTPRKIPPPLHTSSISNTNTSNAKHLSTSSTSSPLSKTKSRPVSGVSTSSKTLPAGVSPPTTPTSARPAPPSPAASRRASSRYSGGSNKPSRLSMQTLPTISSTPTAPTAQGSSTQPHHSTSQSQSQEKDKVSDKGKDKDATASTQQMSGIRKYALIVIRDFAYHSSDPRYSSRGDFVPRPNRPEVLNLEESAEDDEKGGDTEPEDDNDMGSFRGFGAPGGSGGGLFSRLSSALSGGGRDRGSYIQPRASMTGGGGDAYPSLSDLDRNFSDTDTSGSVDAMDEDDEDEDMEGDDDEPLAAGLYRAMYAFEPEGSAEMALEEGQVVNVVGRGGGVGWAVVIVDDDDKEGGRKHALVPESYLEWVGEEEMKG